MKFLKVNSDYSPDTYMKLVRTDDNDFIFKVCGLGEMRIAMSGGQFHGEKLVAITQALNTLFEALELPNDTQLFCEGCDTPVNAKSN